MQNAIYLALLLASVHYLGQRIWSARVGLLAAALLSLYPAVYTSSRQFGADFPGAAMVTLCVALLVASDLFARTGRSLGLGLATGLAVLVRPHSLPCLIPVYTAAVTLRLWRPGVTGRLRVVVNTAVAATVALVVSSPWWHGYLPLIYETLRSHQDGSVGGATAEPSILYYLTNLHGATTPFLLGALALSMVGLFGSGPARRQDRGRHTTWLVWVWVCLGFAVTAAVAVHSLRYILPMLPALALLSARGLCALSHAGRRRVIIGVVLVTAAATWFLCSFHVRDDAAAQSPGVLDCPFLCGQDAVSPSQDPGVLAADAAADLLAMHHDDGHGVIVRMPVDFHSNLDQEILHAFVVSVAVLTIRLPQIAVTGLPWSHDTPFRDEDPVHAYLWGMSAATFGPRHHCYTLIIRQTNRPPVRVEGTRQIHRVLTTRGNEVRFSLWRHHSCPSSR